jgi:hypothetical protein
VAGSETQNDDANAVNNNREAPNHDSNMNNSDDNSTQAFNTPTPSTSSVPSSSNDQDEAAAPDIPSMPRNVFIDSGIETPPPDLLDRYFCNS